MLGLGRRMSLNSTIVFVFFFNYPLPFKAVYLEIKFYQAPNMLFILVINTFIENLCFQALCRRSSFCWWPDQTGQFLSSWRLCSTENSCEAVGAALWAFAAHSQPLSEEGSFTCTSRWPEVPLWHEAFGNESLLRYAENRLLFSWWFCIFPYFFSQLDVYSLRIRGKNIQRP